MNVLNECVGAFYPPVSWTFLVGKPADPRLERGTAPGRFHAGPGDRCTGLAGAMP
jgi:hypothetical protein